MESSSGSCGERTENLLGSAKGAITLGSPSQTFPQAPSTVISAHTKPLLVLGQKAARALGYLSKASHIK